MVVALIVPGLKPCVDIDSQKKLSCTWIDTCSGNCYGVGVHYTNLDLFRGFFLAYTKKSELFEKI